MNIKNEPVIAAGTLVGGLMSVVAFLVVSGIITWSPDQVGAFEAMLIAIVPLVLSVGVMYWSRSKVDSPTTANAKDMKIVNLESKVRTLTTKPNKA